jgi:hypothetical protein
VWPWALDNRLGIQEIQSPCPILFSMADAHVNASKWLLRLSGIYSGMMSEIATKPPSTVHNQCKDVIPNKSLSGNVEDTSLPENACLLN